VKGDIVTISHGLTINLGDYQSLRPSVSIQRTLTEDGDQEVEDLRRQVQELMRLAVCDEARLMSKVDHLMKEGEGLIAFSKALGEAQVKIHRAAEVPVPKAKRKESPRRRQEEDFNSDEEEFDARQEPEGCGDR
jgi:hypothetical protein